MNTRHTATETQQKAPKEASWSRAFEEMRRARQSGQSPNPEVFRDLTKSAGGD